MSGRCTVQRLGLKGLELRIGMRCLSSSASSLQLRGSGSAHIGFGASGLSSDSPKGGQDLKKVWPLVIVRLPEMRRVQFHPCRVANGDHNLWEFVRSW